MTHSSPGVYSKVSYSSVRVCMSGSDAFTCPVALRSAKSRVTAPIAARIDELYFEYHYYFDGHDFGWHGEGTRQAHKGLGTQGDVDTALGLMHRLRELGIRAHFWI